MTEPPVKIGRRAPLGPALEWTDEELDALATVDAQDTEEARAWVRQNAGDAVNLWEAPEEEEAGP
jgi:hypothetical protein